jgi:hypothetical protein
MFIPLILSQGQNLSLLNTAIEQQTIQLVNQISVKIIILIHQNTEASDII